LIFSSPLHLLAHSSVQSLKTIGGLLGQRSMHAVTFPPGHPDGVGPGGVGPGPLG
jgi:hypothetical protein